MTLVLLFIQFFSFAMSPLNAGHAFACGEGGEMPDTMAIPVLDYARLKPYLTKTNDTTYIVNFWATWCAPCVKELPYFEALTTEMKDEKLKVLLVSLDFKKQIESKLIPFIEKHHLESEVVVLYDSDSNFWINDISPEWSGALPATLVYRNQDRAFHERVFHTQEELNDIIQPYLNL